MRQKFKLSDWFVYLVYGMFFGWMATLAISAADAAVPGRSSKMSKECQKCLLEYVQCMEKFSQSQDLDIRLELQSICLLKGEMCGGEHLCKPLRQR